MHHVFADALGSRHVPTGEAATSTCFMKLHSPFFVLSYQASARCHKPCFIVAAERAFLKQANRPHLNDINPTNPAVKDCLCFPESIVHYALLSNAQSVSAAAKEKRVHNACEELETCHFISCVK
jgi:hypothetical protein